jgi:hypothetical protein
MNTILLAAIILLLILQITIKTIKLNSDDNNI